MGLAAYRTKRDFSRTPEPRGRSRLTVQAGEQKFFVQKHAASSLHYDFRLQLEGVLKSWAVPHGPSLDPSVRALAIEVEDHPLEYGSFEGTIPTGQYGAGTVMLWDRGTWEPEGDALKAYRKGKLRFQLHGEKLRGEWTLVRTRQKDNHRGQPQWLLIKRRDPAARFGTLSQITVSEPLSIATGRTLNEIAAGAATNAHQSSDHNDLNAGEIPGAVAAAQPEVLVPQLATAVEVPPQGDAWVHELKLDGYRIIATRSNRDVKLWTRNGNNWTDQFPRIARAMEKVPVTQAIFDGEIAVLAANGTTDFQALQNALRGGSEQRLVYFLFDIPYCDGYDLRRAPLGRRKALLGELIKQTSAADCLRYNGHLETDGSEMLSQACQLQAEGIVSKRADSPYVSGRSSNWLKIKCRRRQEFVVGGFSKPSGTRSGFGALLLGYYTDAGALHYCGRVGTGFNQSSLRAIGDELERHVQPDSPFVNLRRQRGVRWVAPLLVAEVEFAGWTVEGVLRHTAFKGLRRDKQPQEVHREVAQPVARRSESASSPTATAYARRGPPSPRRPPSGGVTIAGIRLTNPQRVLYPEQNVTKRDLAAYYESIADWALPHLINRPLSIVRCPQGQGAKCFYQRHLNESTHEALAGIEIADGQELETYLYIRDLRGLISLVQMSVLEIHPWGARIDRIERPDRLVLDFDPAENVPWEQVVEGAVRLRKLLSGVGLESFVRTTGGKGLHVVVPLARRTTWEDLKDFARTTAEQLVRRWPNEYIATASKTARRGKIFVDYLRNGRTATAIGSYSTRARPGAMVATPITWAELSAGATPDQFDIHSVPQRLKDIARDPWEGFADLKQQLTKTIRAKVAATSR